MVEPTEDQDSDFKEEAYPFVVWNPDKRKFESNEDTLQWLRKIEGPVGVISVAGMYRTGKSYLLNRVLLNQSRGFDVGPTINACTKGVWIWGKPINGMTPEGDPIKILVLDTEGLGALDEDSNHDVRIFSLAILLSSFFLYNSVGSIDENALQNLSLVINLTKHIQIKANNVPDEETDPEDYAQYFPSFMWVVRDFSLQLVDQDQEPITSKDYLEKALGNQKGFSEAIEGKNRIRRMLKSFFKERDCCTMIRPLTNEGQLQNLAEMPMETLRPEFVEQVHSLRRKVLNRIRPKTLNGRKLSGEMLFNLAHSYCNAINQGAVPSIESSWSYICKNQCQKAIEESFVAFEKSFHESFSKAAPMFEDELRTIYKGARAQTKDGFDKVAVGDVSEEFYDRLKEKMQGKYKEYKTENEKICEHDCQVFLHHQFSPIESKLRAQEYDSLYQLTDDLKEFQEFFFDNGPAGPNRQQIVQEFCYKNLSDACEFFIKGLQNEVNLQKELADQSNKKLKSEIGEMKTDKKKETEQLENKLRSAEIEKAEATGKEQQSREQISMLKSEKELAEREYQTSVQDQKVEFRRLIDEKSSEVSQHEQQCKDLSRRQMSVESGFEKDKALLEQKIQFYNDSFEEYKKKEQDIQNELKGQKRDFHAQNQEFRSKSEKQMHDLNKLVEEQKDTIFEKESKLQDLTHSFEEMQLKTIDNEKATKTDLSKTKNQYEELIEQHKLLQHKYQEDCSAANAKQESEDLETAERIADLEERNKQLEDDNDAAKCKWEKDEAIYKQKLEFMEMQVRQEREKQEEQRRNHEQMMRSVQNTQRESVIGKQEANQKIEEMREEFSNQYHSLQQEFDKQQARKTEELDAANKLVQELSMKMQITNAEFTKQNTILSENLSQAEAERDHYKTQYTSMEQKRLNLIEEAHQENSLKVERLEQEIEKKDQEHEDNITEIQQTSEEQLAQLKIFYEQEHVRLETRGADEKDRASKRLNATHEEYDSKLREERNAFEDQIQLLEDDLNLELHQKSEITNHYEHELSLKIQENEDLKKYLKDYKDEGASMQTRHHQELEQEKINVASVRQELGDKVERQGVELTRKDRQITTYEQQKESLNTQLQQRLAQIEQIKAEALADKTDLHQRYTVLKQKNDEDEEGATQYKIECERTLALKDQQSEFQAQRCEELTRQLEKTSSRYEERMRQEKDELIRENKEQKERLIIEKQNIEQKYEAKRKAVKDLESRFQKELAKKEHENAVLIMKAQNLENQQETRAKNYEVEIQRLREQNEQLQNSFEGSAAQQQVENDRLRREFQELDRTFQDLNNNYDKDKALWNGKFEFLEQQKEQAKRDLEDAQSQFQRTVESLQKSTNDSKSKTDSTHSTQIVSLETKYNQRLKELQEQMTQKDHDNISKIKQLEREKQHLTEKLELQTRDQGAEFNNLNKKYDKNQELVVRLQEELDIVKEEREKKIREYQQKVEKERETYNQKKRELDLKVQRTETKQTELLLTHERERAQWSQQKTDLMHKVEDFKSDNERMKAKTDQYIKENATLRGENKNLRKTPGGGLGAQVGAGLAARVSRAGGPGFQPGSYLQRAQLAAGAANPNQMQTEAGGDGSGTDRSYTGRFGLSTMKGEGVAASMDITSQFRSNLAAKPQGTGALAGLSAANPKQFGLGGAGLTLNMKQLADVPLAHELSQQKNLVSTPSSKSGEDQDTVNVTNRYSSLAKDEE